MPILEKDEDYVINWDDTNPSWNEKQRFLFESLFRTMLKNQKEFCHPRADEIPRAYWEPLCWNASFAAAVISSGKEILLDVDSEPADDSNH